jgi:hypothetical protein
LRLSTPEQEMLEANAGSGAPPWRCRSSSRVRDRGDDAIPTAAEALVFINNVEIEPALLVSCILMSILGALLGSSVAARLPVRQRYLARN